MEINFAACSIVAAGVWNRAIFTPEWVAKTAFDSPCEIQIGFGIGPTAVLQLGTDDVQLTLVSGRLVFTPKKENKDCLRLTDKVARAVLAKLPETPLSGFGVNVGFVLPRTAEGLGELLRFADEQRWAEAGGVVEEQVVRRRIRITDDIVNMSVKGFAEGRISVELNQHFEDRTAGDAANRLDQSSLVAWLDKARQLLGKVYGELETGVNND